MNEFLIHWQELPQGNRTAILGDPWRFAQEVRRVEFSGEPISQCRKHGSILFFPDMFENISSRTHKRLIREAFHDRLKKGPTDNLDFDLLEIRNQLTPQEGEGFHFYRSPIVEHWRKEMILAEHEASIAKHDIELIRLSRSRDRYSDFSIEERAAHKRVHEALRQFGETTIAELGGTRDYVLKLTSGFHPNTGIRGGKPKDLWFGIYRKENDQRFLGNPQVFMIVSGRGVEYGFSPLTHPDDFSNQEIKKLCVVRTFGTDGVVN